MFDASIPRKNYWPAFRPIHPKIVQDGKVAVAYIPLRVIPMMGG
jgi:hypothetical protein